MILRGQTAVKSAHEAQAHVTRIARDFFGTPCVDVDLQSGEVEERRLYDGAGSIMGFEHLFVVDYEARESHHVVKPPFSLDEAKPHCVRCGKEFDQPGAS